MLVDTHAHLDALENLEEVIAHAKAAGVSKIITIGTNIESSKKAIDIAEKYSNDDIKIYATVGTHPYDGRDEIAQLGIEKCLAPIKSLAGSSKKIVGVGEAGLDYYFTTDKKIEKTTEQEKSVQRKLFEAQIKLANAVGLPLVIHCRGGWDEIFDLLGKTGLEKGVFHSFTGSVADAQAACALGFYVSFSGIVTFKNAKEIQEAGKVVPTDKILVETDCPYLSPEPFRGQKNEPANVRITAEFLAGIRSASYSEFAQASMQNAQKLFNI